jgi:hypothetical protein
VSAATLSFAVGCSVDENGLTLSLSGAGGANIRGNVGGGGGNSLGGNGAGGTIGAGGTAGTGAGGSGLGGTGVGGTAGTGMGGTGVGGTGVGGRVVDAGPDLPLDRVVVETGPDVPVCDTAHGMHRCGESCVSNSSTANCGPTSCTACPVPANSSASCDGTMCGFVCNTGFTLFNNACVRTCDTNCATKATPVPLPGGRFTGTTTGTSANTGTCGGANAPEAVFQLVLTQTSDVFVTTHGSKFDTVIYMRSGCCGTEIICNNDADKRTTSMFSATSVAPGTYDIFVDGVGTASGNFTVDIYASPSSSMPGDTCGRPIRIADTRFVGNTTGYRNDYDPVGSECGNTGGPDVVFYFILDAPTTVTFDTCSNTCIDTELYLRDVCTTATAANEIACNDDGPCMADGDCLTTPSQSRVSSPMQLAAGVHYVVVDTFVNPPPVPATGLYTLTPGNVPP